MSDKSLMQRVIEKSEEGYKCRAYSGRGMREKSCLGVDIGPSDVTFVADLLDVLADDDFDKSDLISIGEELRRMESDTMGKRGRIVYFPLIQFVEGEGEKEHE